MLDMKVNSLLMAYECGSFVAAAEKLNITQPAVSQHIKALERELNVRIFERRSGRIAITREGERVVQCAKKMAGLYANLKQDLKSGEMPADHLTIGVTHTAESNLIAETLARYCVQNDKLNLKMITGTINDLYVKLRSYAIELAIIDGRIPDPDLKHLLLDTDLLAVVVSVNHPFARRSHVTLEELKRERMILRLPDSGTRSLFAAHLESRGMSVGEFNVVLELDNLATIKALIRQDFGVSILPRSACAGDIKRKTLAFVPVENFSMTREINIVAREDFAQPEVIRDIVRVYGETRRTAG